MKRLIQIFLAVLCIAGTAPAWAATIEIEAEEFDTCYDCALERIRRIPVPTGSGLAALVGLDYPCEWVEYTVDVPSPGTYTFVMRARGDLGMSYHLQLTLTGNTSGESQTVDLTYDGLGFT